LFKHDASRIVQSLIKFSDNANRIKLLEEIVGSYLELSTSIYGHFVVLKALKYAPNATWRSKIVSEFLSAKVITKYLRHKYAGLIIDTVYCLYANAKERQQMLEAFYGIEFQLSKDALQQILKNKNKVSMGAVINQFPDRKERILEQTKSNLINLLSKEGTIGRNEIVHQCVFTWLC
jgi:pumilio family protein 6